MRVAVVLALLGLLPLYSRSEEPKNSIRSLMPKSQADIISQQAKTDVTAESAIKEANGNGLRLMEIKEQWTKESKENQDAFVKLLGADGLRDWVCTAVPAKEELYLYFRDAPSLPRLTGVYLWFSYDGMTEDVKKVVRTLKDGDVVRFTTSTADGKNARPAQAAHNLSLRLPGAILKSMEKVKR